MTIYRPIKTPTISQIAKPVTPQVEIIGCGELRTANAKLLKSRSPLSGGGTVIAGTAAIRIGSGDRFKVLPEDFASFEMITAWVEPKDVLPPRQTLIPILQAE